MKYLYLKQKVFSFTNDFKVFNDKQEVLYECKGQFFSMRREIKIYRKGESEMIYSLQKKIFSWLHSYFVKDRSGAVVARLEQQFSFFRPKFRVLFGDRELTLTGDYWGFNFEIFDGSQKVIQVIKKWLAWGDTYEIGVEDNFNLDFAVALVVMIDDFIAVQSKNKTSVTQASSRR